MQDNKNMIYDTFIIMHIVLNGVAVGKSVSTIRHLIATHDSRYITVLMLWLGLVGYTWHRVYQIRQYKKRNNTKGR